MKSVFVLTLKCLVLSGLIITGCTIAERIDFNLDFSGTRTVEFEYLSITKDGMKYEEKDKEILSSLGYIDSIAQWMDNVSNVQIDTSDAEMAVLTYDFNSSGPLIKNQEKYNFFVNKLPENMRWYFNERPNTFRVINENQILWNGIQQKIDEIDLKTREEKSAYHVGVSSGTTLRFERKIKDITPQIEEMVISQDRKSVTAEIDIDKIFDLKQPNEVIITFE